ncbi:hypothetical protein Tco_1091509 [Tanacetum coccineum]|uniref:Uncharacterized protein n=1 Tax=Tanacetum coccineum TaxID=301880 RepID=A0ABQ5I7D7_9ASTR
MQANFRMGRKNQVSSRERVGVQSMEGKIINDKNSATTREDVTLEDEDGVTFYAVFLQEITNRIACRIFFQENKCEIFTVSGDGVRIFRDGVTTPDL